MYGLTHRFATTTTLADVTPIGASVTVMVIDRDRLTLTLVREAIAGHYDVVSASDSGEALALINAQRPDVVLLDMSLEKTEVAHGNRRPRRLRRARLDPRHHDRPGAAD